MGGRFLDADTYYWAKTDPPFTLKRAPAERIADIERDIAGVSNWVLSGSICSWGDPLLERLTFAVFLYLNPEERIARLIDRERQRYGSRIESGGDMRTRHLEFIEWARSYESATMPIRSLDLHERWMQRLSCPIIRLDSSRSVDEMCAEILQRAAAQR